jgi:hypothetical protein
MSLWIGGYLALIFITKDYVLAELIVLTLFSVLCCGAYLLAVFKKPLYQKLPQNASEDKFLDLLKRL